MEVVENVFKVSGQSHSQVKCTFSAEKYFSTYGRPSVVRAAKAYPIDGSGSEVLFQDLRRDEIRGL